MALIGEIRKNFWFVLIILGLALAAFVIMDMTSSSQMGNTYGASIGSINGEKIDAREFSTTENVLSQNSSIQDANARRENLWNYYIDKTIVEGEAEKLGLTVPVEELKELQFGQNLSPVIQQIFYDPQIGGVNRQQLAQVESAILNNQELGLDFRATWSVQEKQVIANQLEYKLTNLVTKAAYTPNWLVEQEHQLRNTRAQVAYVKVPFDAISNDQVEVSDADITAYINKNKDRYTNKEETRVIEYITFPIRATSSDSTTIYNDLSTRTLQLLSTENDSIYAVNNKGAKPRQYYTKEELPEELADSIDVINIGEGFGPYLDNGVFSSVKLVDRKVFPDSVEARVIYINAAKTNTIAVENAKSLLDSLKNLIVTGQASFDSLAMTNSQDGSSARGGDLGYLTQGFLPAELDEAIFFDGNSTGKLIDVQTAAGLFLIELTDVIQSNNNPKYRLAYINASIIPSKATQDSVLDVVNDFISDYRTLDEMKTAAAALRLDIRTSQPLNINSYQIGNLGSDQSSRNIVRWAFDPTIDPGDVSPDLFSYQNPNLYFTDKYVVVGLDKIIKAGVQKAEDLRDELLPIVTNQKKGEAIKAAITNNDLNAVASQYSINVDTIVAVARNASLIPSLGNEPKVVAAIFSVNENEVAGPVVGNSGVFVVKPIEIVAPGEVANIPSLRSSTTSQARSNIQFSLMDALRKKAKIKDERYEYGF